MEDPLTSPPVVIVNDFGEDSDPLGHRPCLENNESLADFGVLATSGIPETCGVPTCGVPQWITWPADRVQQQTDSGVDDDDDDDDAVSHFDNGGGGGGRDNSSSSSSSSGEECIETVVLPSRYRQFVRVRGGGRSRGNNNKINSNNNNSAYSDCVGEGGDGGDSGRSRSRGNTNNTNNTNNNSGYNSGLQHGSVVRHDNNLLEGIRNTPEEDESYGTMECRERDMGVALQWIRQQMRCLRKQNKSLLKQFTNLRAGMLQLRYAGGVTHGSLSDLSIMEEEGSGGIAFLGNKGDNSGMMDRLTVNNEYCSPGRAGKKSVSLPSSPLVARSRKSFVVPAEVKMCGGSVWDVDRGSNHELDDDLMDLT